MNSWQEHWSRVGPHRCAWVPIPLFLLAFIGLRLADVQTEHEFPYLLLFSNLVFLALAGFVVAFLFARSFLFHGAPGLLLIGCGAMIWGASGVAGVIGSMAAAHGLALDANTVVTIHNICIWEAALLQLLGAAFLFRGGGVLRARGCWLSGACALTAASVGFVLLATRLHWTPVFFEQGKGGTPERQFLLGSTIVTLFLIATLLQGLANSAWAKFMHWYTCSQLLLAVGYLGIMIQTNFGGILGWTGRGAQYLGGIYMVVAAIAAFRERTAKAATLAQPRMDAVYRYGFAIAVVLAAAALRLVFLKILGTQAPFLTFYPAVVLAALYGGTRAGLAATVMSALLADYFYIDPTRSLDVEQSGDLLALAIFTVTCFLLSWVAGRLRKADQIFEFNTVLEREIAERTKGLQTLLETASDGIHVLDGDGNLVLFNKSFLRMLGYDREEAATLNVKDWDAAIPRDHLIETVRTLICRPSTFETAHRRKDGTILDVEINARSIELDGKSFLYNSARDITERKKTEQALVVAREAAEQSSRAKSDFLTSMSHELRTPLNGILGFAQLIDGRHYGPLTTKQKEFVDAILVSGDHLYKLINDILELSKIEVGRVTVSLEEVDLVPLVKSVVANLQPSATAAGIGLVAGSCGLGLPAVHADRVRLAQCLYNLGTNAIKYNRPGGSVTLAYGLEGDRVRLSVIDTGVGIAEDRQSELFQPFNRLGAEQNAIEGTGIGLVLTRRLMELMEGKIGFASTLGQGSRFWIDIPVYVASAREPHPIAEPVVPDTPQGSGFSVLYVEDNPSNLVLMRNLLATREGIRLIEATTGAAGLAAASRQRPDLIILDINLPDTDGVALLKQLKDLPELATTPILALSANAMPRDIKRGIEAGFFDYITKPLDVNKFLKTIDAALASARRNKATKPTPFKAVGA